VKLLALPKPAIPRLRIPPCGSRRTDAKRAVLFGLLAVFAAHLWLAVRVETDKPHWRDPEFFHRLHRLGELAKWRNSRGDTGPLVVVIGGSRPQQGISPVHLGRGLGSSEPLAPTDPMVFDLVQSGMMMVGERLAVNRMFDAGRTPDFVLLELRASAISDAAPFDGYFPPPRLGFRELSVLKPHHRDPARVAREWLRDRATSWYTLRRPLLDNWKLSRQLPPGTARTDFQWRDMTAFGWSAHYPAEWPEPRREQAFAVARSQYEDHLSRFHIEPGDDRLLRESIAECQAHGAKVALYVMPESPRFRAWYPPGARERFQEYYTTLSRELDTPVFDAMDWLDDESAFMDGHHLLGPAAERFSERLGRECVKPWIAGSK
jgi:hypothetical protein